MSTPKATIEAYRLAQILVSKCGVTQLANAALDVHDDDSEWDEHVRQVRRALVDAYRDIGAQVSEDYDGDALLARVPKKEHDELQSQLWHREEAGYVYGLAMGLALANVGGR
jgi:hypothetical protein